MGGSNDPTDLWDNPCKDIPVTEFRSALLTGLEYEEVLSSDGFNKVLMLTPGQANRIDRTLCNIDQTADNYRDSLRVRSELKREITNLRGRVTVISKQLAETKEANTAVDEDNARLLKEKEALRQRMVTQAKTVGNLRNDNGDLSEENERLLERIEFQKAFIRRKNDDLSRQAQANSRYIRENLQLKARLDALNFAMTGKR